MEVLDNKTAYENKLNDYVSDEKSTVNLISSIGHLMYEKSIELVLFRNPLVDKSISQILKLHKKAKTITSNPVSIHDTAGLAAELVNAGHINPKTANATSKAIQYIIDHYPVCKVTTFKLSEIGKKNL